MENFHGVSIMALLEMLYFFGTANSLSSHIDSQKKNFLVLGKGTADGINASTASAEKNWY